jgi:hypothetical protein
MKAIRKKDITFSNSYEVDFQKNKKLFFGINALSILFFLFFYLLFDFVAQLLGLYKTSDYYFHFKNLGFLPISANLIFLAGLVIILTVHELIHGFFFYLFTKERPVLGFKSVYAYAGAPDWYIKKNYFQVITLSPLIFISIAGLILMSVLPAGYLSMVFILATVNAAGSIGDLYMSTILLTKPVDTYINDSGISAVISYDLQQEEVEEKNPSSVNKTF